MQSASLVSEATLTGVTVRQRAILKIQYGWLPLNAEELDRVLPEKRAEAAQVKSRNLQEVATLIGISRERVRQINTRSLNKLAISPTGENT